MNPLHTLFLSKPMVAVLGAGLSGCSVAKLLLSQGAKVTLFDDHESPRYFKASEFSGPVTCHFGTRDTDLSGFAALVLSPGVPLNHPLIKEALAQNLLVVSEIDLAAWFLPKPKKILVSGTNGKSTTTSLLATILSTPGKKALAAGNIGRPLSDIACDGSLHDLDYLVIEMSSFQIESSCMMQADLGLLLNITPDHLDRYATMDSYIKTKARMARLIKPHGALFASASVSAQIHRLPPCEDRKLFDQLFVLVPTSPTEGENEVFAARAARALGVSDEDIARGMANFAPLPHRCQLIGCKRGVDFIDDSKGTTVASVAFALKKQSRRVHLLLGGIAKEPDFTPLSKRHFPNIVNYYIYGRDKDKIKQSINEPNSISLPTLEEAVNEAFKNAQYGDAILLSPACSSYDQFRDYIERSEHFYDCFKSLEGQIT